MALHNSAKRGDIVGVEGFPGKSKMGELSIFPRKFVVLSPCLHMPPTVRSGLKDQVRACVALSTHARLPGAQRRSSRDRQELPCVEAHVLLSGSDEELWCLR